jgi:hypothetical protein
MKPSVTVAPVSTPAAFLSLRSSVAAFMVRIHGIDRDLADSHASQMTESELLFRARYYAGMELRGNGVEQMIRFCDRCHRPKHSGKCVGASRDPDLRKDLELERLRKKVVRSKSFPDTRRFQN